MDRVFTAINRGALPERVVYSDFAAARAIFPIAKSVSAAADSPGQSFGGLALVKGVASRVREPPRN
jgi:hypothetical protein